MSPENVCSCHLAAWGHDPQVHLSTPSLLHPFDRQLLRSQDASGHGGIAGLHCGRTDTHSGASAGTPRQETTSHTWEPPQSATGPGFGL